jgi:hypothetical protein
MSIRKSLRFALIACLAACSNDSTGGRVVALRTQIAADAEIDDTFATATGWEVRLDNAALSLGALYYFEGEPAFVLRQRTLLQRVAQLLGPSVAYAHPGHYVAGQAVGQMIQGAALALASEPAQLPDGNGVTGLYRSARFVFARSEKSDAALKGAVASVEGTASKGERRVHFQLSASWEDVLRNASNGEVNGCVFDEADVQEDGSVQLTVRPRVWLNLVDFDEVASGSASAPTKVAAGETAQLAFAIGVVQLSAYRFSYRAEF